MSKTKLHRKHHDKGLEFCNFTLQLLLPGCFEYLMNFTISYTN